MNRLKDLEVAIIVGITEHHPRVVVEKQRVIDHQGVTGHGTFEYIRRAPLVYIDDGHAINRTVLVAAS